MELRNYMQLLFYSFVAGLLSVCAASDSNQTTDSDVSLTGMSLSIQGTRPGALASAKAVVKNTGGTDVAIAVKDATGAEIGTLTLTTARLSLKEIEFELAENENESESESEESEEESELEFDFEGPYVVDVLTNTVDPPLSDIQLAAGTYEEIEMKLDKIEGDEEDDEGSSLIDESDPLFGNSIYLEGSYEGDVLANDGVTVVSGTYPFRMSFDFDEEFSLTGPDATSEGFTLDQNADVTSVIIAFRLAKWFTFTNIETNSDEYDFTNLVLNTDSELVLDKDTEGDANQKLREVVKENIKESADYGEDKDDDGELGSDEDDDDDEEDEDDD